ncbi:ABC transporter permease [Paracoccus tibetensis]|uniref:ABC-type polysaccharide/polyol phosphate export permease n=1 Tax=Paracoccus tibetensis TaxID=336292 RepID=A0A1G5EBK2_9RHOB|nr:ABC transporter [Paracoccus tibetensis]SCY24070.1 ABC-type polysaccharide/polyol phosphate export permease [Paracoccus tibetensis]
MFQRRQTRTMAEAAFTTLSLIYHQTVFKLRNAHRSALMGILMSISQTLIMIAIFMAVYYLIGIRSAPLRGDYVLFIISGVLCFMTLRGAVSAVSGSYSINTGLLKHEPLNPAVMICAAALSILYQKVITCIVVLGGYYLFFENYTIYQPLGVAKMLLMSWIVGCSIGFVFLGIQPWAPDLSKMLVLGYTRISIITSGKAFLANVMPNFLLPWFIWNPLFHLVDQSRGYMFINYTPHRTSLDYPIKVAIGLFGVGLLINFATRKYESLSWTAGR